MAKPWNAKCGLCCYNTLVVDSST